MSTLTLTLPEQVHDRLKKLARRRGVAINELVDEFSQKACAEMEVYRRFRARARRGSVKRGLALLDKLDATLARR